MSFPILSLGIRFLRAKDCLSPFSVLTQAWLITITSHVEQELGKEFSFTLSSLTVVPMATTDRSASPPPQP